MSTLTLTPEWDKAFPKAELVNHCKVTFHNRYGIELAADMYVPKECAGKLPAIAVSGPFGAVKEQSKSWAATVTISYKTVPCFLPLNDYKRVLTMF